MSTEVTVIYHIMSNIRALEMAEDEILESPRSTTDLILQVFDELRTNRPKPLENHCPTSWPWCRGVSSSSNMEAQRTSAGDASTIDQLVGHRRYAPSF